MRLTTLHVVLIIADRGDCNPIEERDAKQQIQSALDRADGTFDAAGGVVIEVAEVTTHGGIATDDNETTLVAGNE